VGKKISLIFWRFLASSQVGWPLKICLAFGLFYAEIGSSEGKYHFSIFFGNKFAKFL